MLYIIVVDEYLAIVYFLSQEKRGQGLGDGREEEDNYVFENKTLEKKKIKVDPKNPINIFCTVYTDGDHKMLDETRNEFE